jgi:glycosyltransferase domain-containing protein
MIILIPTYNRPNKLARTLEFYHDSGISKDHEIQVLDGSGQMVSDQNHTACKRFGVIHIPKPEMSYFERLDHGISKIDDDDMVCLCPDEDVFLPDFLKEAEQFLEENIGYTIFNGRYITYSKPLFKLHRVNFSRDMIVDLDMSDEDPSVRASMFITALMIGSSPIFWGVRRSSVFKRTLAFQKIMNFGSASECVDQILMCLTGKVRFTATPMMIRDETKVKLKPPIDHHDSEVYINTEDELLALNALKSEYGEVGFRIGSMFLAHYSRKYSDTNDLSISTILDSSSILYFRSYWRPNPIFNALCRYSSKAFVVLNEIVWAQIVKQDLQSVFGKAATGKILKIIKDS